MSKIFLTGSSGTIGTVIRRQVPEHTYTLFDLPDGDARDYQKVLSAMRGSDVAVHLAWNTKIENWQTGNIDPDNSLMTFNVYKAALESGTKRVIMASSIHANDLLLWDKSKLLKPEDPPIPDSPYGASKIFMEAMGQFYSKRGLEVVCIRIMGVNPNNQPGKVTKQDPFAKEKWFSHRDLGDLIRAIVSAPAVPNNFSIIYGVSNNTGRPADVSNPFGWVPKDNSADLS